MRGGWLRGLCSGPALNKHISVALKRDLFNWMRLNFFSEPVRVRLSATAVGVTSTILSKWVHSLKGVAKKVLKAFLMKFLGDHIDKRFTSDRISFP